MTQITPELRERLSKIYELVKRGAEGERDAARIALDKILSKHSLNGIDLDSLDKNKYHLKYSTDLELVLLNQIIRCLSDDPEGIRKSACRYTRGRREVGFTARYSDWITIECAFEYFRRHMKTEWKKTCAPELNRCRKNKTKVKLRDRLQQAFLLEYMYKSGLYKQGDIKTVSTYELTNQELKDRKVVSKVEGGKYNKQVTNGLLLDR